MNLYEIQVQHTAPKDSNTATACYLIAKDEESVYEWIKSEPHKDDFCPINSWKDTKDEGDEFNLHDDDYNIIGTETFKEKIIRIKGEMNDEDYDYSDAYYGITLYGWELIKEGCPDDTFKTLSDLGVLVFETA